MNYDIAIIGAGPAGYEAALHASQLGLSCVLFEKREIGGTCLNRGCIPTKSLLHSAQLAAHARNAGQFGISCGQLSVEPTAVFAAKDSAASKLRAGIEQQLKTAKITVVLHEAQITAPHIVLAGGESYRATSIIVACGGAPSVPPISGAQLGGVVDSDGLLNLGRIPESLVIIGGGVIGCEFAAAFLGLGSKVTVIEAMDSLLANMDTEIGRSVAAQLKKDGAQLFTAASVESIENIQPGLEVRFNLNGVVQCAAADTVLVATGRKANTAGIFAEGIEPRLERGAIVTDNCYRTGIEGVYAVGDARSGAVQLAHSASAEGVNAVRIAAGLEPLYDMSVIPSCVYCTPEIACVGLTAEQARAKGVAPSTGKALMTANGRSVLSGAGRGFIKLVFDSASNVLIGAQLMCENATDIIGEWALAVSLGLNAAQLERVIRAHPTYYEAAAQAIRNRR